MANSLGWVIDRKLLLADLQKQVKFLEKDLREQTESVEEVRGRLRGEYDRAFKVGRTAATWAAWRDERVTQAAVAVGAGHGVCPPLRGQRPAA